MNDFKSNYSIQSASSEKSIIVAYLLWLFFGYFGLHRLYLNKRRSGFIQLLLLALGWIPFFVGWIVLGIWWVLDAYFIYIYTHDENGIPLSSANVKDVYIKCINCGALVKHVNDCEYCKQPLHRRIWFMRFSRSSIFLWLAIQSHEHLLRFGLVSELRVRWRQNLQHWMRRHLVLRTLTSVWPGFWT